MTMPATRQQKRRSCRRGVSALLLSLFVLLPAGAMLLAVEPLPRVTDTGPPDAAAAAQVRDLALRLQDMLDAGATGPFTVSEAEMNAAMASIRWLQPGVAGHADVREGLLELELSAGAPLLPKGLWANVGIALAPSEHGLEVTRLRIGRLPLPAAAAVPAVRVGLDRLVGEGLGTFLTRWITGVRIDPPLVTAILAESDGVRTGRLERLRARILAKAAGPTDLAQVQARLQQLHRAGAADLSGDRSALPFLRRAVQIAGEGRETDPRADMQASIIALALYCGDPSIVPRLGMALPGPVHGEPSRCAPATLGGRNDLMRHFVLSAGIHAASSGRTVLGLGELKELLDSNPGGSGFSFDDMAANLAGARFAATLLEAPRDEWPDLLTAMTGEADILPALDGLPSGLDDETFRTRFGDIDSPAYREVLAEIEGRIDALAIHRGG